MGKLHMILKITWLVGGIFINMGEKYIDSEGIYLKLRGVLKKCREENGRTFKDLSIASGFKEDELKNIEEGIG